MKSRKRGPAPPVVRGPLATLRGLRLTFCSRGRSDLFTPPATRRGHRLPGDLFTPAVPPDPLERAPLPALSAGIPRPRPPPRVAVGIGPVGCSRLGETALPFRGQPPTMIYWNKGDDWMVARWQGGKLNWRIGGCGIVGLGLFV